MKPIFIDTNIILDVVLDRKPFVIAASRILNWAEFHPKKCGIAYHSVANIHYIAHKLVGKTKALLSIESLLQFLIVGAATSENIIAIMNYQLPDFEDALQIAAAQSCKADYIITRNFKDYKRSPVKAVSPIQFLSMQA